MKKIVYAVGSERLIRRNLKNYRYAPEAGFWAHSLARVDQSTLRRRVGSARRGVGIGTFLEASGEPHATLELPCP